MMTSLFDPNRYVEVRKPLAQSSTLSGECYTSDAFFQKEVEKIFAGNWQFVGRVDEIAKIGDYICFDGVAGSAIIIRSESNKIHGFLNTCRHRGSRLLSGAGQCIRIVCPYHSWVYGSDGQLLNTPGMDGVEGFDQSEFPLKGIALEIWQGFIFINFSYEPAALSEGLGDFFEKFSSHQPEQFKCVKRFEFDVASNWKLLAENALEAYHTGTVHKQTLGQQKSKEIDAKGAWTGLFVEEENSVGTMHAEHSPLPHIHGLSDEAQAGTYFTMIYPCTQFVFAQDCMWWLALTPKEVGRTRVTLGACFPQASVNISDFQEIIKSYFHRWEIATEEDNRICESQFLGQLNNNNIKPGRYATSEFATHALANWVLDQILETAS